MTAEIVLEKYVQKMLDEDVGYVSVEEMKKQTEWRITIEAMQEFAKYHITEALKQASENFKMKIKDDVLELSMNDDFMEVDKDSILNAYPLNNIK